MSIYKNGQKVLGSFNDVTGFVEKSDITTTIDSSSTNETPSGAKAVYDFVQSMLVNINGTDRKLEIKTGDITGNQLSVRVPGWIDCTHKFSIPFTNNCLCAIVWSISGIEGDNTPYLVAFQYDKTGINALLGGSKSYPAIAAGSMYRYIAFGY